MQDADCAYQWRPHSISIQQIFDRKGLFIRDKSDRLAHYHGPAPRKPLSGMAVFFQGNFLTIPMVVFFPGYVLCAALFPRANEIDWPERITISFALSIAAVTLVGGALDLTTFGIRLSSSAIILGMFTVSVGVFAYWRRIQLPISKRLSLTLEFNTEHWRQTEFFDRILTVAVVASLIVATSVLAFTFATPSQRERFTDFYILGLNGMASDFPRQLNVSQIAKVTLGIANHESINVTYTVRSDLVGIRIVYNATSGRNETVEINRTRWSSFNVPLADGQNWTRPYTFQINNTSLWKIQFLLFKDDDFSSAYRELQLYVRVT